MNTRKAWTMYIVLRLVFFVVPFTVLMLLLSYWEWPYWPAALVATLLSALIAVSLSLIFLSKPRETASESIYEWRNRERTADDIVEDEAVDAAVDATVGTVDADPGAIAADAGQPTTDLKRERDAD